MNAFKPALCLLLCGHLFNASAYAGRVGIEWETIEGASQYELQVRQEEDVIQQKKFPVGTRNWVADLPFGVYTYRIRGIDHRQRPGDWSDPQSFLVAPPPPVPQLPANGSTVTVSDDTPVVFKWEVTEKVERYLVELVREKKSVYQGIVTGTELSLPGLGAGDYSWTVRPILESLSSISEVAQLHVVSPSKLTAAWTFSLVVSQAKRSPASERAETNPTSGLRLALSDAVVPYQYEVSGPTVQGTGTGSGVSNRVLLEAQYFLGDRWSIGGEFQATFSNYGGRRESDRRIEIGSGLRLPLSLDLSNQWYLRPHLGLEFRSFNVVVLDRTSTLTLLSQPGLFGPKLALTVGRVTRLWEMSLGIDYLIPIALFGAPTGSSLSGGENFRNLRLGVQSAYWIASDWAVGGGVFYGLNSASYLPPGQTSNQSVRQDGLEIQAKLIHPI